MNVAAKPNNGGSVVPSDVDGERRVLGILIRYPDKLDEVADRLEEGLFYDPTHKKIFRAIRDLFQIGGRISYTQVYNKLRKLGDVGSPEEQLIQLTQSFISQAELVPSIEVLREKAGQRRLMQAAHKIEEMILLESEDNLMIYQAKAQQLIFQAANAGDMNEEVVKDLLQVLNKCYLKLLERREGKTSHGLTVRFPSIDVLTTGFKKKDLIILAARPSMGKTAFALNMAMNVAKRDTPVLIFSMEMDDEQIGDRIVISELFRYRAEGEISSFSYNTKLSDADFTKTQQIFNELYSLPIKVIDKRGLTVGQIRSLARKVKSEWPNLGVILIDYLQLIRPPSEDRRNWALLVGDIVREIRDLAGELNLPIILLSQLNRGVESRDNKRPMMSDLRDSGNIEEFADVVMFLYREDYYYPEQAEQNGTSGQVEIIFAKQRKGPTGKATLHWIPEYTRFIDEANREE